MDGEETTAPSLLFSQIHFFVVHSEGLSSSDAEPVSIPSFPLRIFHIELTRIVDPSTRRKWGARTIQASFDRPDTARRGYTHNIGYFGLPGVLPMCRRSKIGGQT